LEYLHIRIYGLHLEYHDEHECLRRELLFESIDSIVGDFYRPKDMILLLHNLADKVRPEFADTFA
jgi:hypothetical protein